MPREPTLKYSIIIPAYNESQRIGPSLEKVFAHIAAEKWDAEVLVVNDGSRDDTPAIVRSSMARHPNLRLLENPGNKGKGYSVRHGMVEGTGDVLLLTDADLSSPIYEAGKLFGAIAAGSDIAIGSRWRDPSTQTVRQPWYRQLGGRALNLAIRMLLGLQIRDTQCGFKAFTRQAAKSIFPPQKTERWGFDPEILYLAKRLGFTIAEVPVEWAHDDRSKISPVRDAIGIVRDIVRVRLRALAGGYSGVRRAA